MDRMSSGTKGFSACRGPKDYLNTKYPTNSMVSGRTHV